MRVAAIQLTSTDDKTRNLAVAVRLMSQAVDRGARLVALPEYFAFIGPKAAMFREAERPGHGQAFETLRAFARDRRVCVLAGGLPMRLEKNARRLVNRSILFGPTGAQLATYDKLHLFDSDIQKSRAYRESATFQAGKTVRTARTPLGRVGFSICYDLRFPELYRALAFKGARIIFAPSAFTAFTGKDHWLTLIKARAIENQVFIVAPAQFGRHAEKKVSFGKSCIVDPWGKTLAVAADRETVIVADLDFEQQANVRRALPALKHRRKDLFSGL